MKTEHQRVALALLKARPPVLPGTRVVLNDAQRKVWYDCVTQVALALGFPHTKAGRRDAKAFFDAAGVP